jgi:tetrapyrrole methylase family protein/MazG family protein
MGGILICSAFQKLIDIMGKLRGPNGCPWDKEQTHDSLKPYLLEESYEVLEALDSDNVNDLKEELGDLLLQIVFHTELEQEKNNFTILDVLNTLNDKLIRRHPHVFGDKKIRSAEEQTVHWERIKKKEGKVSVLDGVPKTFPALLRARRIQQKAASVGFDWNEIRLVWEKINEEIAELQKAIQTNSPNGIHEELGDILFSMVNLSRFLKVDPEESLRKAIDKFIVRFQKVEQWFEKKGTQLQEATLEEMDAVWNHIKNE